MSTPPRASVYADLIARGRAHIDSAFDSVDPAGQAAKDAIARARSQWSTTKSTLAGLDTTVEQIPNRVTQQYVASANLNDESRTRGLQDLLSTLRREVTTAGATAREQLRAVVDTLASAGLPPKPDDPSAIDRAERRVEMVLGPLSAEDPIKLAERAAELLRTAVDENEAALAWVIGGSSWFRDYLRSRLGDERYARQSDAITAVISTALDTDGSLRAVRQLHNKIVSKSGVYGIEACLGMLAELVDDLAEQVRREAPRSLIDPPTQMLYARDNPTPGRPFRGNLTGGW